MPANLRELPVIPLTIAALSHLTDDPVLRGKVSIFFKVRGLQEFPSGLCISLYEGKIMEKICSENIHANSHYTVVIPAKLSKNLVIAKKYIRKL